MSSASLKAFTEKKSLNFIGRSDVCPYNRTEACALSLLSLKWFARYLTRSNSYVIARLETQAETSTRKPMSSFAAGAIVKKRKS